MCEAEAIAAEEVERARRDLMRGAEVRFGVSFGRMTLYAARSRSLSPGGIRESKLEQSHVDRKSRERSRSAIDVRWQSCSDILPRDQPFVERRRGLQAGEDGVAPLRRMEYEVVTARRHRRAVREEG